MFNLIRDGPGIPFVVSKWKDPGKNLMPIMGQAH